MAPICLAILKKTIMRSKIRLQMAELEWKLGEAGIRFDVRRNCLTARLFEKKRGQGSGLNNTLATQVLKEIQLSFQGWKMKFLLLSNFEIPEFK